MNIFPNPAGEIANIAVTATESEKATLTVYNSTGLISQTQSVDIYPGKRVIQLRVNDLPTGMYFVKLEGSENTSIKRLVKN